MPVSLSAEFRATDFGQKAERFLEELYRHQDKFPIAIGKAATLLCFLSETVGTKSLRDWERGGILPNPLESGRLTLPGVMIAKLTLMRIFEAQQQDSHPTYREIYCSIQENLRNSQFERSLGTLQPEFSSKIALVNVDKEVLFDEERFWWIDPVVFMPGRRSYNRYRA